MSYKSFDEINEKIREGTAVVVTAEEMSAIFAEKGAAQAAKQVDVVTTGTFGPMCSSGMFINFGHSNPPIRMSKVWLNDVSAYGGIAAVDAYIGATEQSESKGMEYGGAHVIEDFIAGKDIKLRAVSGGTDCYPRKEITTWINKQNVNQAFMFNPRNAYQNYAAAANTSDRTLYTYMGTLLPRVANITYSTSGQLSPLLNDPYMRTIGLGTRIFLGGAEGYVAWEGTQHNPGQARSENGTPVGLGGTLALIGDTKKMNARYIKAGVFENYGVTLFVGIGIPIPILDEDMAARTSIINSRIFTNILDYSVSDGPKPVLKKASYEELRSGYVEINGNMVPTAPLSSMKMAREIADNLKGLISRGEFLLSQPVASLPDKVTLNKLEIRREGNGGEKD